MEAIGLIGRVHSEGPTGLRGLRGSSWSSLFVKYTNLVTTGGKGDRCSIATERDRAVEDVLHAVQEDRRQSGDRHGWNDMLIE